MKHDECSSFLCFSFHFLFHFLFFRNEFLAVRNAEGSFYVCQAMQNIYKSSRRIRIRWLSQDKNNGEIYSPDFYDFIGN